jgi:predicted nucleic acid-binding protein
VKVLVDTDVLIDVALGRDPHRGPAGKLLDRLERRDGEGFLAWHSASNFYYLVSPRRGKQDAKSFLLDLTRFVDVAPVSTESLRQAATLGLRDFEDAMQVAAAIACGADVIATRNVKDYSRAPVKAAKPEDVLKMMAGA